MNRIFLPNAKEVWCLPTGQGSVRCVFDAQGAGRDGIPVDYATTMPAGPVAVYGAVAEPPVPGAVKIGLRALFDAAPADEYAVAAEAVEVCEWRRTVRFCGGCGEPLVRDKVERCMVCPKCGQRVYPRLNPAVITCITRNGGEEVLLARRAVSLNGFYSVIAGFVEAGESLEHAVVREVREEVGIEVTNLRYFGSQAWPFPNSLMLGFRSEYAGGELRPDGVEIAEAGWFRRDALPTLPGRVSIARRMVDAWTAEG